MYIERPKGLDISDERITLTLRDENGLRAGTITIVADGSVRTRRSTDGALGHDIVRISVERVPGDESLRVEFVSVN